MTEAEIDLSAEQFHIDAIEHHEDRLLVLLRADPLAISREILITVYDLLAWSVRLHRDVRRRRPMKLDSDSAPQPDNRDHIALGADWARNQIVHGRALRLLPQRSIQLDNRWNSTDIVFNDPEVSFNGVLQHPTIRLVRFERPVKGDRRPELQPFYNECVAGRRIITVSRLLRGERTLGKL